MEGLSVAIYCIAVSVLMAAWWAMSLHQGVWSRNDRTHAELGLHLAAEFAAAAWLVASGVALLTMGSPAIATAAAGLGMLFYTTIVSPDYFVARRELPVVAMFVALGRVTAAALPALLSRV